MPTIKSLNKWANAHTYYPLDLLRIALGVFLFLKGINFISNSQILVDLLKPVQNLAGGMIVIHYVAPAHLIGGILIAFGLLTRWSVAAQLPLLIGAIVINFVGEMNVANLVIASVVFLLCVFFLFYGSGKHSVDYYLKMQQ
ncbi:MULTISPECIES: DoxX family protein [Aquimarina]|uniref:DoxX family protein n=1 Tax=Aquimarina rubra TaxID=1920033 RepID=A0ABW5LK62_9FLAO